jgi:MFS family permease
MPFVSFISAFLAALALFWLIVSITENSFLAFVGTLIVMFGSALIVGIGAINGFYENGVAYPFFPFLRRYIPSLAFPFLFAFFACLWNGLQSETRWRRAIYSAAGSGCFAALVFSYFYVWTAAGAVLFGLTLFVVLFRSENWRKDFLFLTITGAVCFLALLPYALLLANRNETMDKAQLLVFTRQPDLLRTVEIIGYLVLTVMTFALWRKFSKLEDRKAYIIATFALAPLLVFNQQIFTGRSLQPFHYEFYVINYVVLLAAVLVAEVFWQRFISRRTTVSIILLSILGLISIFWGYIEAKETTKFWDSINIQRDEAMLVNTHLRELADGDIENAKRKTTLNLEAIQADSQPTVAPQAVLWARHQHVFAGLENWNENKQRYYQMLYYSDLNADWLRRSLTGCRDIEACMALFGWDRFNARLSANARPLTLGEVEEEVSNYARFSRNFSVEDARNPQLSYLIVHNKTNNLLTNLDVWYERQAVRNFGKYSLYELKIKEQLK